MTDILITGTNRGIGLGFTKHYLAKGARVFAGCRNPSGLNDLKTQYGDQLVIVELDVTVADSIRKAREIVEQHTDSLDLLINNAGILQPAQSFKDISSEALMKSFAVNTVAPIMVIQAFVDLLEKGENPKIINITMPTPPISKLPQMGNHHYVASRYALNGLTKLTALELAEKGIITVGLYPSYLKTDMNNHAEQAANVEEGIPIAAEVIDKLTMEQNGLALLPNGKVYEW